MLLEIRRFAAGSRRGLEGQVVDAVSAAGPQAPAREQEKAARIGDPGLDPEDRDACLRRLHEAETGIESFNSAIP